MQAGLATIPLAILSISLSTLFGSLAGKYGPRLFMTAAALVGAGFLLMLFTTEPVDFWVQLLPGHPAVRAWGLAVTVAPLTAAILGSISPAQSRGSVPRSTTPSHGLRGDDLAGAIVGSVLDVDAFHRVVFVVALLFIAGGIVSFVGIRNQHVVTPVTPETAAPSHDRPLAGAPTRPTPAVPGATPGAGPGAGPGAEPGPPTGTAP